MVGIAAMVDGVGGGGEVNDEKGGFPFPAGGNPESLPEMTHFRHLERCDGRP